MKLTRWQRFAAWAWDNIPGGVPVQLWVWVHFTRVAIYCEFWVNERDYRERRREQIRKELDR